MFFLNSCSRMYEVNYSASWASVTIENYIFISPGEWLKWSESWVAVYLLTVSHIKIEPQ